MDPHINFYRRRGKRIFDVFAALAALVVLAPLLGLIALVVRIALGSPVVFRQIRGGLHQHPFYILKFRSMTDRRDAAGEPLPDNARITRLGRFLRATSLDELPELLNVLKGDMSLVGPRPLYTRYERWYTTEELRRFDVRPGITGWAQISGRNSLCWDDRFRHDLHYVGNCSLKLDVQVLVLTVGKVLRREDVHVEAGVTVPSLDQERSGAQGKSMDRPSAEQSMPGRRARPTVAAGANINL
jgi:sugar transferase EpsL